ncbi:hypothetical protein VTN77DRAFT_1180 [Rasamsonia byssochlamydoides]|uniref:uncharacterized protein n=1 Tax=Rasamsonia byssochlamydoides TaxID=89139 RepID=UPI00374476DA
MQPADSVGITCPDYPSSLTPRELSRWFGLDDPSVAPATGSRRQAGHPCSIPISSPESSGGVVCPTTGGRTPVLGTAKLATSNSIERGRRPTVKNSSLDQTPGPCPVPTAHRPPPTESKVEPWSALVGSRSPFNGVRSWRLIRPSPSLLRLAVHQQTP